MSDEDLIKAFEIDLAVALATCPKRYLDQARSKLPEEADRGREAIAKHCAPRMRKWIGLPPGKAPKTH